MNPKYDPKNLFLKRYDYGVSSENEKESTDKKESTNKKNNLLIKNDLQIYLTYHH